MINKVVVSRTGITSRQDEMINLGLLLQEYCGYNMRVLSENFKILLYLDNENYGFTLTCKTGTMEFRLWSNGVEMSSIYQDAQEYYRINNSSSELDQVMYCFNYVKTEEGIAWGISGADKQSIFACHTNAVDIITGEETIMYMLQTVASTSNSTNYGYPIILKTTENTIVNDAIKLNVNFTRYANNMDNAVVMSPIYLVGHNVDSIVMAKGVYETIVFPPVTNTIEFELNGVEYVSAYTLTWKGSISFPERKPRFIFKAT